MISSMTAFAREAMHETWGQAVWEIRSVNHRYLEMSFKVPDSFRQWEAEWRQKAARLLQRGKVEFYLSFTASSQTSPVLEINEGFLAGLLSAVDKVSKFTHVESKVRPLELLRWPDVLSVKKNDFAETFTPISALLDEALQTLIDNRQREGGAIQKILMQKRLQARTLVGEIKEAVPQLQKNHREKLLNKIQALTLNVDPQRLEQEIVFLIQRSDIEEELDRLEAHLSEVEEAFKAKEAVGRRLDFLMQEMNREANTIAAKTLDHLISEKAIALKVLIEQMREQIQNVE